jgi:dolichol-phosphate mannosyltransferase
MVRPLQAAQSGTGPARFARGYTGPTMTSGRSNASPADPDADTVGIASGAATDQLGAGVWVIVPTYNEAENLRPISAAILDALPAATLLVVDDGSPDGTGTIAAELATADPRIRVRHRRAKEGLGRAYLDGFGVAIAGDAQAIVQMDADWSHDPAVLPELVRPIQDGTADLVIGSRYAKGGGVVDWGLGRRIISRGGSLFARTVLNLGPHDLTGGFKAWRRSTLEGIPFAGVHAGGYVFQIEMTFRASRAGARIREVPITFRDRRIGQSKMSRRIVIEALVVVVQLRIEELFRRFRRRYAAIEAPEAAAADSGRAVTDTGPDPRPAGEGG